MTAEDSDWHENDSSSTNAFKTFVDGVNNNWDLVDNEFAKLWHFIYLVILAFSAWGLILMLLIFLIR